ncbi:MAG: hypothetical protein WA594_08775 [Candidatus Sulfotelmatobacter sp.]
MTARSLATTCTRINGAWTRQITIFVGRSVDEIQLTGTISITPCRRQHHGWRTPFTTESNE